MSSLTPIDSAASRPAAPPVAKPDGSAKSAKDEGFGFWDFIDVINPLQHIPVVSTIYRELTHDTIKAPAKVAGSALFFGVVGVATAIADVVVESETGKDMGANVMAMLGLDGDEKPAAEAPTPAQLPNGTVTVTPLPPPTALAPPTPATNRPLAAAVPEGAARKSEDAMVAAAKPLVAASNPAPLSLPSNQPVNIPPAAQAQAAAGAKGPAALNAPTAPNAPSGPVTMSEAGFAALIAALGGQNTGGTGAGAIPSKPGDATDPASANRENEDQARLRRLAYEKGLETLNQAQNRAGPPSPVSPSPLAPAPVPTS